MSDSPSIELIKEAVICGHVNAESRYPAEMAGKLGVEELVQEALAQQVSYESIMRDALIAAMDVVGEKYSRGEYFVPQMLFCARAMKAGLEILRPLMVAGKSLMLGTVILATVQGDMHDIGKNLVAIMLEGAGYEVMDLGVNVPVRKFLEAAEQRPQAVVGMSALLSVTMLNMREIVDTLNSNGCGNKIIIGGAPVSPRFADEIGADAYAPNAAQAVMKVRELFHISS